MNFEKPYDNEDKWMVASIAGLIFIVVSSPYFYGITRKFFNFIASKDGCPTTFGVILHAIIYICVVKVLLK